MTTGRDAEGVVLSGLTRLMAQWSSLALQAGYAHEVGIPIDPADVQPLYLLGLDGQRRASDLAAALRVSRPTMSKQLSRLDAAGLIAKTPDATDGRAILVSLSPAGARAYAGLVDRGLQMVHHAMADWSADERRAMADLVDRFAAAAGSYTPTPDLPAADGTSAGSTRDDPETRDRLLNGG